MSSASPALGVDSFDMFGPVGTSSLASASNTVIFSSARAAVELCSIVSVVTIDSPRLRLHVFQASSTKEPTYERGTLQSRSAILASSTAKASATGIPTACSSQLCPRHGVSRP